MARAVLRTDRDRPDRRLQRLVGRSSGFGSFCAIMLSFFEKRCGLKPAMELGKGTAVWLVFALSMLLFVIRRFSDGMRKRKGGSMKIVSPGRRQLRQFIWFGLISVCETTWAVLTSYAGSSLLT